MEDDLEDLEFSEERIIEMQQTLEKAHGRPFSMAEAKQALWDIRQLAEILISYSMEQDKLKQRLKEHPKGFHIEHGGMCPICMNAISSNGGWFDKYEAKCVICQDAVNERIIPGSVATNKESWYSEFDLEDRFNIKGVLLNSLIKQSVLKVRIIKGRTKKVHYRVFLIKDNKDVLPPKKLVKSRACIITVDGENRHTSQRWYEFIDERGLKQLSKYKIMGYLHEAFKKPVETGRISFTAISPIVGIKK